MNDSVLLAVVVLVGAAYLAFRKKMLGAIDDAFTQKDKALAEKQGSLEKQVDAQKETASQKPPEGVDPKEIEKYWRNN